MSGSEGQFDSKRRTPAHLRSEIDRTIQKLHNSKRAGQPDAAASRPRGEKKLEDFLPVFQWNAFPGVRHGDFRHFPAPAQDQPQLPPVGHGLRRVQHQIQHRLLQQRPIHKHFGDIDWEKLGELDIGSLEGRLGDFEDFLEEAGEVSGFEANVHGTGEIEKTFDDGVEAIDFLVENLNGLLGGGIALAGEGFLQVFKPEAHGVERIFDFVSDAGGDAAESGEALADLQLGVDAFERIEVAQSDERAHLLAVFLNGLNAGANAARTFAGVQFSFDGDFAELIAFNVQRFVQRMAGRKNLGDAAPEEMPSGLTEKFFGSRTDHDGARIASEKQSRNSCFRAWC